MPRARPADEVRGGPVELLRGNRRRFVLPNIPKPYSFETHLARYRMDDKQIPQDVVMGIIVFTYWQYVAGITGIDVNPEDYRESNDQRQDDRTFEELLARQRESQGYARHVGHTRSEGHRR